MSDLGKLTDPKNRDAILLAEVAALLHDDSKHTDQFVYEQAKKAMSNAPRPSGKPNASDLIPNRTITLLGQIRLFSDVRKRNKPDFINGYLKRCHNTAHIDKQDGEALQSYPFFVSTPFGFESSKSIIPKNLTRKLRKYIAWSSISKDPFSGTDKENIEKEISNLFSRVGADTRRPSNEIPLWDWGHIVGAFYKASLAGALLGFQPSAYFMRWRLLSIRFDGISFFAQSSRLSDLLSRQELLKLMLNEIRQLLEIEYPIGTEVYRDENGSIFIVPGCYKGNCTLDLLALEDRGKTFFDYIKSKAELVFEGEFIPSIKVDSEPWWGQDPNYMLKKKDNKLYDELPPLSEHLQTVKANSNPEWISMQWIYQEDICTVCGLRPQGSKKKSKERKVCDICEDRRNNRSKEWATKKLNTTIWINEVADTNARLALVIGCFNLDHWLSGDLIHTMTICNAANTQNKNANDISKNHSFVRLRRIWETTRSFWQDTFPTEVIDSACERIEIRGALQPVGDDSTPGKFHVYDLLLSNSIKLSVVWDPTANRFITADNLDYLNIQLGRSVKTELKKLSEDNTKLTIEEPTGYGVKNKIWGTVMLNSTSIEISNSQYTPAIPILAEPRTFMALVPADKALDVVDKIKAKYEREMGKVRNRLPLHLGIVYAHRRTPLRAILDAGRKMLDQKYIGDVGAWTVTDNVIEQSDMLPHKAAYLSEDSSQFTKWYPVCLKHQEMNRELVWYVPAVMGDGTTSDNWYPYVFWRRDSDGNTEPSNTTVPRSRYFKSPNPWKKEDSAAPDWLVHAGDLKEGDLIYFTPATLDFQWLDSAGRRFEIAYDKRGQRFSTPHRPYLLDEIEILNEIWQTLSSHLTKNQIYILRDLIEAKREDWNAKTPNPGREDVFWRFCRNALANLQWNKGKRDNRMDKLPWEVQNKDCNKWLDPWADYAVRGWITDAIELHLQIMKEEVQDEF